LTPSKTFMIPPTKPFTCIPTLSIHLQTPLHPLSFLCVTLQTLKP
jgi:hypothetical protein